MSGGRCGDGGTFAVFEQMRVGDGDLPYPLPWAEDSRYVVRRRPDEYVRDLEAAGFSVTATEDRTAQTAGPPASARVVRRAAAAQSDGGLRTGASASGSATTSPPPARVCSPRS